MAKILFWVAEKKYSKQNFACFLLDIDTTFDIDDYTFEISITGNALIATVVAIPSGISDIEIASIQLYPNPVKDVLTIESGELTINNISIHDISGRAVETWTAASLQTINVSSLPQGVYFLKIETYKGVVTKKFIKE